MTRPDRPILASILCAGLLIPAVGCGASASVQIGGSTLDHPDQSVSQALYGAVGQRPESVSCPDGIPAEDGHRFRCVLTEEGGKRFGVTVVESAVQGEHLHLHVQVDKQPLR